MRIALLPDDYLPHSTLVHAKMFHELALELKRLGHEPVVVTPSHGRQSERLVIDFIDGVEVWRFKNPPMRGKGKIQRVISESMLSLSAFWALKEIVFKNTFDACINYSPTIFFGPLMWWLKKYCNTYNYLILRDMFPQWVVDEGLISESSPITKYFRFFEHINYKASDCIGLMSQANVDYFSELNPKYKNLQILKNWADLKPISFSTDEIDVRVQCQLQDKIIFFYGGNIGHAQDMGNLLRLAKGMKPCTEAHFLFIGQGDEVSLVHGMKEAEELDNVTILPSISQSQYKQVLTQVDIGLFSLAKTHKAHNFPGKLLGYMVQSLPILGSVNQGNDLIRFIRDTGAGFTFVNGEDEDLLEAARTLLNDPTSRQKMGDKAYSVLKQHFSVNSAAEKLITTISKGAS
ncbi:glycosyltransferase family 4 protein [Vibrio penaeicida]|uniref:glycosyltransferase family 4 protein n=1 Tax=Vibrio penaeicida TaxID=104609 RepID=UPI000CE9C92F|nr:glycosyltransferase family 4 protein [Vibrio penaeicida]